MPEIAPRGSNLNVAGVQGTILEAVTEEEEEKYGNSRNLAGKKKPNYVVEEVYQLKDYRKQFEERS
eukprot:CAMPEP_0202979140 /NCGR_PEP_ID=MMETSP1396-20130829/85369_1 /ASSEMBLY_ACC=CAM_ASM_000872 /TAXON_ID= /ORGANISM="Pseudokeronopsis sp., Strain Brazil" /LENGTH=65 /DNA_ID=CAMNT_0049718425 /DNA_START=910 /DNA_END=1107 /DNA_ORIENTATION=+